MAEVRGQSKLMTFFDPSYVTQPADRRAVLYYRSRPLLTQADIDRVRGMLETVFSPFDREVMEQALEALADKYGLNRCPAKSDYVQCDLKQGHGGAHEGRDGGAHCTWRD